jgi:hypothetical protein
MKNALNRMNAEVDKTFSNFSQKIQDTVKVASALSSIYGAINTVKGAIDTIKSPETSGWEKFGAVISTISTVLMAVKSVSEGASVVMKGYNTLIAIGTGLEALNTLAK